MSVTNTLVSFSYPIVLSAAAIYAGCSCWWRRRRRAHGVIPKDVYPGSVQQTVDQLHHHARALEDTLAIAQSARVSGRRLVLSTDPEAVEARYVVAAVAERVVREERERVEDLYEAPTFTHQ